jgi:hypothetical protein
MATQENQNYHLCPEYGGKGLFEKNKGILEGYFIPGVTDKTSDNDDECKVKFVFKKRNIIDVTTKDCQAMCGSGVHYDGVYVKENK